MRPIDFNAEPISWRVEVEDIAFKRDLASESLVFHCPPGMRPTPLFELKTCFVSKVPWRTPFAVAPVAASKDYSNGAPEPLPSLDLAYWQITAQVELGFPVRSSQAPLLTGQPLFAQGLVSTFTGKPSSSEPTACVAGPVSEGRGIRAC